MFVHVDKRIPQVIFTCKLIVLTPIVTNGLQHSNANIVLLLVFLNITTTHSICNSTNGIHNHNPKLNLHDAINSSFGGDAYDLR